MSNLQIEEKLFHIENSISKLHIAVKAILSADEAASFLGIKPSYLYKLTSERKILHFKPMGKLLYFRKQDLEDFLLRNPSHVDIPLEQQTANNWVK